MCEDLFATYNKYPNVIGERRGGVWKSGSDYGPACVCYGDETDEEGCPFEEFSYPVIAVDNKGVPHIAVLIIDYRDGCKSYWIDANTEKEISVEKWMYIPV